MGTSASRCPADEMMHQMRRQAIRKPCTHSKPSDFYCACRDGDIDYVREHLTEMSIEDVDKLERNGDTAVHVATRNEHKEIVQLLVNAECSRTTLNYCGKMPHEEIKTPEMSKIYERPTSTRFHELNPKTSLETFKPRDQEDVQQPKFAWIQTFENEREIKDYSLNQQTTAMWFQFFNWVSHTFSERLDRDDFHANLFDLESDRDFATFLKDTIQDDDAYKRTREALKKAEMAKDIVPLITLYTSEFGKGKIPFYEILNKQLALVSEDDNKTAHFCDRFICEFNMKSDQLEKRAYAGQTFRGVSMNDSDVEVYEELTINNKKGIIATKTFTSTSKNKKVALKFAKAKRKEHKPVLFVFNIPNPCNTIVSVKNISRYPQEEEVLIIPGNLFRVERVAKNPDLTEIHLEHMNVKISFYKKITQTIKAARQRPSLQENPDTNIRRTKL
jgi:hypothetical protein